MKLIAVLFFILSPFIVESQIIDSDITLEKALEGSDAPKEIIDELEIVSVEYYSYDSLLHRGQIVLNKSVKSDIIEVFEFVKSQKFLIEMVIPVKFDMPNGMTSMAGLNNCYMFHYRTIAAGSKSLSRHAKGEAIDFNPFFNPYISTSKKIIPQGAVYEADKVGTILKNSPLVKKFKSLGWTWGGDWVTTPDYMHFEKTGI